MSYDVVAPLSESPKLFLSRQPKDREMPTVAESDRERYSNGMLSFTSGVESASNDATCAFT